MGQRLHLPKETLASSSLAAHEDLCAEEDELMRTILQHTQDLDVKPLPTKTETIVHHDPSATETDETAASEPKDDKVMTDEQVLLQQMHRVNVELGKQTDGPTGSVTKSQPIIEQVLANQSPDTERPGSGNTLEQSNRKLSLIIGQKNDQISADDLKKRQDYLRMQRDKLIELKRKERSKQIVKVGESEMKVILCVVNILFNFN